jgi:tetratricopeptide (TPR) repeat protein
MVSRVFEPGRAVEIVAPKYGSAYRIGGRLVLTCAHVLFEVGSQCCIRAKQTIGKTNATVVWKAQGADVALIELPESVDPNEPVVFGILPFTKYGEKIDFQMYVWPKWGHTIRGQDENDENIYAAGGRQVEGVIYLADRSADELLVLEAGRIGSEWQGASGAAVVCNGLVVAVQRQHQNPNRPASLEAELLSRIYEDSEWCTLLRQHGIPPEPQIVVLQGNIDHRNNLSLVDTPIDQDLIASILESIQSTGIPQNLRYVGTFNFVGRNEILTELHDLMQGCFKVAIASISGMGGVGKTELALQYAIQHLEDYPGGCCWLDGRGLDLGTQVIEFGITELNLNPPEGLDLKEKVEWCWRCWKPDGNVLLIVDDVFDYKDTLEWLPKHEKRFRVIITSRERPGRNIRELKLMPLSVEAAFEMLLGLVGIEKVIRDEENARQICSWLGHLPLGLELVGRYIDSANLSLAKMLELLEQRRLAAHALLKSEADMTAQRGIAEAFDLSWGNLTSEAKNLAAFLSLFSLAPISWAWIETCFKMEDTEELIQSLQVLTQRHIVQTIGQGTYQLHPLIREFLRDKLQKLNNAEIIIQTFCNFHTSLADTIPVPYLFSRELEEDLIPVIPHIEEVANFLVNHLSAEDMVKLFNGLAAFYKGQGTYSLAENWLKKGLSICQNRLGSTHKNTASMIQSLAFLYYLEEKYNAAEILCKQALTLQKNLLGEENLEVADTMDDLAKILTAQDKFIEAQPLYLQALEIRKNILGERHIDVAVSLGNIGTNAVRQHLYVEAEHYYLEAIDIESNLDNINQISLAYSFSKLSRIYIPMNRYSDLEKLLDKMLELRKAYFGKKHPFAQRILMNLAKSYKCLGKSNEAKLYFEEALDILTRTLGSDHESTVDCRRQLQEL